MQFFGEHGGFEQAGSHVPGPQAFALHQDLVLHDGGGRSQVQQMNGVDLALDQHRHVQINVQPCVAALLAHTATKCVHRHQPG
jgi:hypothetical protein